MFFVQESTLARVVFKKINHSISDFFFITSCMFGVPDGCLYTLVFAAVQPNLARSPLFDQDFPLLSPDTVGRVHLSSPTTFWLNVEVLAQQFDSAQTKLSAISIAETQLSDMQFNSCLRKKHLLVADLGQFIVGVVVGVLMLMARVIWIPYCLDYMHLIRLLVPVCSIHLSSNSILGKTVWPVILLTFWHHRRLQHICQRQRWVYWGWLDPLHEEAELHSY